MRNHTRLAATALLAISLIAVDSLEAQRRTTGGSSGSSGSTGSSGSSGGRSAPSSGGRSSSGSSDSGRRSAGSADRGRSEPSRPEASSTGGSSTSTRADRPSSGKIGSVRRDGERAQRRSGGVTVVPVYVGGCWSCDYWGWYGGRWGRYHGGWWYPSHRPHPSYDEPEEEYVDGVVQPRPRGYGVLTAQYFADRGSETQAGRFALEGGKGALYGEIEYSHYAEPVAVGMDRMQTLRGAIGVRVPLTDAAKVTGTLGLRGLYLNNTTARAGGPEGSIGLSVRPASILGANITGRIAGMQWRDTREDFALRELNTTGSVFIGSVELQAGWHWMKVGNSPAFGGPVMGLRLHF